MTKNIEATYIKGILKLIESEKTVNAIAKSNAQKHKTMKPTVIFLTKYRYFLM